MANRTALFVRKQTGGMFAVVDTSQITGNVWFVDSGNTSGGKNATGYGQNPDAPFLTWDYAVGQCTENNGDVIFLMPGHAETLTAAGAVTIDKAGIETKGLGEGAARPTFTFSSTDNSASVLITAASNKVKNIIGICGDDGLTNPFHVQAADCELDITWRDPTDVEAASCVLTTAAADRLKVKLKYEGYTGGNACVSPVQLIGVNEGDITVDFYGKASTAVVDMNTTLSSGVRVRGYFYNSGTTDMSKNVTANVGSCLWFVEGYDGAAGQKFSGGSAAAVAGDDVSAVASQCTSIATGTVSLGTQVTAVASQATSIATGAVSLGTQTTAVASQATSIATGAVSLGTQVTAVASQATSIATGAVSLGTQVTAVASQATSIATGTVSVGAQVLSAATSIGTGTSTINSQAISIATGAVSVGAQVLSSATSVGTATSVINSQAISIATGTVSVGAQVLSAATSIGTGTSVVNSQAISIATGMVSVGTQVLNTLTKAGTEFSIKKAITDKTTIITGGLLLTGASATGELNLTRVTLQNDGTVTGGNIGGALIYTDDATYPLEVSLTNAVFAASGFVGVDINYPLQIGKKVGIKAVTGNCTGLGSLVIVMTFNRNADGATIAAA